MSDGSEDQKWRSPLSSSWETTLLKPSTMRLKLGTSWQFTTMRSHRRSSPRSSSTSRLAFSCDEPNSVLQGTTALIPVASPAASPTRVDSPRLKHVLKLSSQGLHTFVKASVLNGERSVLTRLTFPLLAWLFKTCDFTAASPRSFEEKCSSGLKPGKRLKLEELQGMRRKSPSNRSILQHSTETVHLLTVSSNLGRQIWPKGSGMGLNAYLLGGSGYFGGAQRTSAGGWREEPQGQAGCGWQRAGEPQKSWAASCGQFWQQYMSMYLRLSLRARQFSHIFPFHAACKGAPQKLPPLEYPLLYPCACDPTGELLSSSCFSQSFLQQSYLRSLYLFSSQSLGQGLWPPRSFLSSLSQYS